MGGVLAGEHKKPLAQMREKPAHLIVAPDKGEANLILGAPKENSLSKPGADFVQRGTQFGQTETRRQLACRQGSNKEVHPTFDFQSLDGIESLEASLERGIEGVVHLQTPEIPKGGLLAAERLSPCAPLRQVGEQGNLLIGEGGLRHNCSPGQQHLLAIDDKSHEAPLPTKMERPCDRLGQMDVAVCLHFSRNHHTTHSASSLSVKHESIIGPQACQITGTEERLIP